METRYTSDVAQLPRYARSFFEKRFRQREKSDRLAIPIPIVQYQHYPGTWSARFVCALKSRGCLSF